MALLLLLVICAFCTATFSSVWNYSAHSYFGAQSEYAIIHYKVNYHFYFKVSWQPRRRPLRMGWDPWPFPIQC